MKVIGFEMCQLPFSVMKDLEGDPLFLEYNI